MSWFDIDTERGLLNRRLGEMIDKCGTVPWQSYEWYYNIIAHEGDAFRQVARDIADQVGEKAEGMTKAVNRVAKALESIAEAISEKR